MENLRDVKGDTIVVNLFANEVQNFFFKWNHVIEKKNARQVYVNFFLLFFIISIFQSFHLELLVI